MPVESINSYTPPPVPQQSVPATSVEEVPVTTEVTVEAPNTNVNVDIIA